MLLKPIPNKLMKAFLACSILLFLLLSLIVVSCLSDTCCNEDVERAFRHVANELNEMNSDANPQDSK